MTAAVASIRSRGVFMDSRLLVTYKVEEQPEDWLKTSRLAHHVPESTYRVDQLGLARIDFPPQQPHENFQRVFVHVAVESPHRFENRVPAGSPPGASPPAIHHAGP